MAFDKAVIVPWNVFPIHNSCNNLNYDDVFFFSPDEPTPWNKSPINHKYIVTWQKW